MNAELPEELLSAYLDGELSDAQRELVDQRLKVSSQWRDTLARLRASSEAVRQIPECPLGRDLTPAIWQQIAARQAAEANGTGTGTGTAGGIEFPLAQVPISQVLVSQAPGPSENAATPTPRGSRVAARRMRSKSTLRRYLAPLVAIGIAASLLLIATPIWWGSGDPGGVAQQDPPAVVPADDNREAEISQPSPVTDSPDEPDSSEPRRSTFPTIEELAQQQAEESPRDETSRVDQAPEPQRSPFRMNIRTGRRDDSPENRADESQPGPARAPQMGRQTPQLAPAANLGGFDVPVTPRPMTAEVAGRLLAALGGEKDGAITDQAMREAIFKSHQLIAMKQDEEILHALDANEDGQLTMAEIVGGIALARAMVTESGQQAKVWMFRLDANEDGHWSSDDLTENIRFLGNDASQARRELGSQQEELDSTRDRRVHFAEALFAADRLVEALEPYEGKIFNPRLHQQTMRLFQEYDRDRNGRLGSMELRRLIEAHPGDLEGLSELPAGSVTPYELYLALERELLSVSM
ncbi:MAG: hypothetical protein WD045_15550 [Pirellulaceae bacterium]